MLCTVIAHMVSVLTDSVSVLRIGEVPQRKSRNRTTGCDHCDNKSEEEEEEETIMKE